MSETPAETIRRAVAQLRNPVFCGDRATPAIADWLDSEAVNADAYAGHSNWLGAPSEHALKVALAYLGEAAS